MKNALRVGTNLVRRNSNNLGMSPVTSPVSNRLAGAAISQSHAMAEDPQRPEATRTSGGRPSASRSVLQGQSRAFSTTAPQAGWLSFSSGKSEAEKVEAVLSKHVSMDYLNTQYELAMNGSTPPKARNAEDPPSREGMLVLIAWKSGGLDKKINDARTSGIDKDEMDFLEGVAAQTIDKLAEKPGGAIRNTVMDLERLAQYEVGTEHTLRPLEGYTHTGKPRTSGNVEIQFVPKDGRGTVPLGWGGQFSAENEGVPGSGRKIRVTSNEAGKQFPDEVRVENPDEHPLRTLIFTEI